MSAPPSSKRMRGSGEAGVEEAAGDAGAGAAGGSSTSSAAATPAMLRPAPDASPAAALDSAIAAPAPSSIAEGGSSSVEAMIPCISMVAEPSDGTSVLAVFWDRHSERLGEEGFMRNFTTREARVLRLVCREFRETVDATAWNDLKTRIGGSLVDWRASFPNAIAANVSERGDLVDDDFTLFRGFHALDVSQDSDEDLTITDAAFVHLMGIRKLFMRYCNKAAITDAIFANLRGIEELDMRGCDQAAISSAGFEQLRGIETLSVDESRNPLIKACLDDDMPEAEATRLIENNSFWINVNGVYKDERWSPLHLASHNSLEAVVLRLLEHGANPNATAHNGIAPLYHACRQGKESTARLLIKWGADVNQRASNGETAIQSTSDAALKALLRSHGTTD